MEWTQISIDTTAEGMEPLAARLTMEGIEGLMLEDADDFAAFCADERKAWELIDPALADSMANVHRITFFDTDNWLARLPDVLSALRQACPEIHFGPLSIHTDTVKEADFIDNWKQYYEPLPIGQRLLIQPRWLPVDNPENRAVFLNDPGVTFGTGNHASTRLCLHALERWVSHGDTVLDLGCGSGILGICALLLGAKSALGVDIDPLAVKASQTNALANAPASDRYEARLGDLLQAPISTAGYDIVCANLVADLIVALAPGWQKAPPKTLIASGIIDTRRDEVCAALTAQGFTIAEVLEEDGWVCLIAH